MIITDVLWSSEHSCFFHLKNSRWRIAIISAAVAIICICRPICTTFLSSNKSCTTWFNIYLFGSGLDVGSKPLHETWTVFSFQFWLEFKLHFLHLVLVNKVSLNSISLDWPIWIKFYFCLMLINVRCFVLWRQESQVQIPMKKYKTQIWSIVLAIVIFNRKRTVKIFEFCVSKYNFVSSISSGCGFDACLPDFATLLSVQSSGQRNWGWMRRRRRPPDQSYFSFFIRSDRFWWMNATGEWKRLNERTVASKQVQIFYFPFKSISISLFRTEKIFILFRRWRRLDISININRSNLLWHQ